MRFIFAPIVTAGLVLCAMSTEGHCAPRSQPPAFVFRGHAIGDALETFQNEDDLLCKEGDIAPSPSCHKPNEFYNKDTHVTAYTDFNIADITFGQFSYVMDGGRFAGIDAIFKVNYFEELLGLLSAKYGKPDESTLTAVTNGFGAQYSQRIDAWNFAEGQLILKERGGSIGYGTLVFHNPIAEAHSQAAVDAANKIKAEAAF